MLAFGQILENGTAEVSPKRHFRLFFYFLGVPSGRKAELRKAKYWDFCETAVKQLAQLLILVSSYVSNGVDVIRLGAVDL